MIGGISARLVDTLSSRETYSVRIGVMSQAKLLVLLSRKSGARKNIRADIETLLTDYKITADIHEVDTPPEAVYVINQWKPAYEAVVVYGGDGTVTSVIKALVTKTAKLIILPGGTGNLIAKYLRVPSSATALLKMYLSDNYSRTYYDVSSSNNDHLILDIHMGWLAESTLATNRELKKKIGMLAYGVKAVSKLPKQQRATYRYRVDDEEVHEVKAYSSIFANKAIQNFFGFKLFNKHDRPSTLEVAFLLSGNPLRFLVWVIGRAMTGRNLGGFLRVHYSYKVEILEGPDRMLYDDEELKIDYPLVLRAGTGMVTLVVPKQKQVRGIYRAIKQNLVHIWYVVIEQFRNTLFGTPLYKFSQVLPLLYLGGSIRPAAKKEFSSWGVKAIVNMRQTPDKGFDEFDQLHLSTKDLHPPTLAMLNEGVEFIAKNIRKGRGVYVHCRHGRGRGPTMVAAYLIAKHGMTTTEALNYLSVVRPMTELLKGQRKRLREFEASVKETPTH
jgi:diacylglycerol kinase family enzyme